MITKHFKLHDMITYIKVWHNRYSRLETKNASILQKHELIRTFFRFSQTMFMTCQKNKGLYF